MNENLYSTTKKRYSVFCVRVCVLYMRICIFVYGKSNQIKSKLQCAHNIYTLGKCVAIAFNTILLAYMRLIDACARSACAVMFNAYFHLFLLYCFPKKKLKKRWWWSCALLCSHKSHHTRMHEMSMNAVTTIFQAMHFIEMYLCRVLQIWEWKKKIPLESCCNVCSFVLCSFFSFSECTKTKK